ncbi:MAG: hypothetical protein ACYC3W_06125, partial [Candidatus Nanopelagicales bacterium]
VADEHANTQVGPNQAVALKQKPQISGATSSRPAGARSACHFQKDLYPMMFCESRVGDVLFSRKLAQDSISMAEYSFNHILELREENGLRIAEIDALKQDIRALADPKAAPNAALSQ